MSLESKIEALTAAIDRLNATVSPTGVDYQALAAQPAPAPSLMPAQPAPVAAAPAAAMPPAPNFAAMATPAPAAPAAAPFTDINGLIAYATQAYTILGPEKGMLIGNIPQQFGVQNVNEIPPAAFAAFYQAVEALKAQ